jgi:predicted flavoprotein YhiN
VCTLSLDLHPDLDLETVASRLRARRPKDSLATGLRRSLGVAPVAVGLLREATGNTVPVATDALASLVKNLPLRLTAPMSLDRAISTAGGVAFGELDASFMVRRLPGVFVAGEMLDWDAPTGGYLLQASFSTGVAAARGALAWMDGDGWMEADG